MGAATGQRLLDLTGTPACHLCFTHRHTTDRTFYPDPGKFLHMGKGHLPCGHTYVPGVDLILLHLTGGTYRSVHPGSDVASLSSLVIFNSHLTVRLHTGSLIGLISILLWHREGRGPGEAQTGRRQ